MYFFTKKQGISIITRIKLVLFNLINIPFEFSLADICTTNLCLKYLYFKDEFSCWIQQIHNSKYEYVTMPAWFRACIEKYTGIQHFLY